MNLNLTPYSGVWDTRAAAHLVKRCLFDHSYTRIHQTQNLGLNQSVNLLLQDFSPAVPPINYYNENDLVPIGSSWVDAPHGLGSNSVSSRFRSLMSWTVDLFTSQEMSLSGSMLLFWSNHLAIQKSQIADPNTVYNYTELVLAHGLGNIKTLIKEMTINPAMLLYLNGAFSSSLNENIPNENFGRELLELFTIGKGPLVAPGDYTNYTERDIKALSRSLSGWSVRGYLNYDPAITLESYFRPEHHDTGDKQLSSRFNNEMINNEGAEEYKTVIDIIFNQWATAKAFIIKIYKWFVFYKLEEGVEDNIINPLTDLFIANDFEIKPVLEVLLKSEHFFDNAFRGVMIKNPVQFYLGLHTALKIESPVDTLEKYGYNSLISINFKSLQMDLFEPPNVAGWKVYYQNSGYRIWLNAATIPTRIDQANNLSEGGVFYNGALYAIPFPEIIEPLNNGEFIENVINYFTELFLPHVNITQELNTCFQQILLNGAQEDEWTSTYLEFLDGVPFATQTIKNKVKRLIASIIKLPEYQLQ